MLRYNIVLLGWIVSICLVTAASGTALTPGNLLIGFDRINSGNVTEIREYTRTGTFVQSWTVTGDETIRDLFVTKSMQIAFYHGTFDPVLTVLNPVTGAMSDKTLAGWSTINNGTYGGVTAVDDVVIATDMSTANAGSPNGLVRFDTAAGGASPQRFMDRSGNSSTFRQSDYIDVNLGRNGKLYALRGGLSPSPNSIEVFDPITLQSLSTIQLPTGDDMRALAVGADSSIFIATWDGEIIKYSAAGAELGRIDSNIGGLADVDISSDGAVLGSINEYLFLTNLNLSTSFNFDAPGITAIIGFGGFAEAPVAVPEPAALGALVIGAVALQRRHRSRS